MEVVSPLLCPIGKALFLDLATYKKTKGSMAKVKIQIDLTKLRPYHVWLGFNEEENSQGKWKKIQYEGVQEFYTYCKHQEHNNMTWTIKRWDDEFKKTKKIKISCWKW